MKNKFRIWNKTLKTFVDGKEWFLSPDGSVKFFDISENKMLDASDYTVVQFSTEIIDRDGQEIYEGDFILYELGDKSYVDIVGWENFGFRSISPDSSSSFPIIEHGLIYKVVGNNFENPEFYEKS